MRLLSGGGSSVHVEPLHLWFPDRDEATREQREGDILGAVGMEVVGRFPLLEIGEVERTAELQVARVDKR